MPPEIKWRIRFEESSPLSGKNIEFRVKMGRKKGKRGRVSKRWGSSQVIAVFFLRRTEEFADVGDKRREEKRENIR